MGQEVGAGGGANSDRVDFESLLEELTAPRGVDGLQGFTEDVPLQAHAAPEWEDLAGITALLALRNSSPIERLPLHTGAQVQHHGSGTGEPVSGELPGVMPGGLLPGEVPGETPGELLPGEPPRRLPGGPPGELPEGMAGWTPGVAPGKLPGEALGVLPGEAPGKLPGEAPVVCEGKAAASRGLEFEQMQPAEGETEERSARRRENRGAVPSRKRDPWAGVSTVLSISRVEKATKKRVPLSRDWSRSKILTGPDHEAAIEEEHLKREAEEAEKERKKEEREKRAAENAAKAAERREEAEKARQARVEKAKAAAAEKEEAQKERAAKRKFDELWEANTKVLQGLLYGGMAPAVCAHGWTPSLRPVPATVRAVRQRRMNKIKIQREFRAQREKV